MNPLKMSTYTETIRHIISKYFTSYMYVQHIGKKKTADSFVKRKFEYN